MSRKYFTLVERDKAGEPWSPQFGDYDRTVVAQELIDRSEAHPFPRKADMRIVTSGATQGDINHAIFRLNHPTAKV